VILEVIRVSKRFGGLQALSRIDLKVAEGQILGLIGPNGAGKTTLFNVINGVYAPDEGQVIFRGTNVTGLKTYELAHMGLARTHQIVRPLNELTVRENVMVGACFGREKRTMSQAGEIADEVLQFVGLISRVNQQAGSLNVGQKKRLELARALAAHPHLLLLDEVLAGLTPTEIGQMLEIVRQIRDQGTSIIMIEHVMHAVMNVSDEVFVLDFGQAIAQGTPKEVANNPKVIEAYLGNPELSSKLVGWSASAYGKDIPNES
jgi:branched-chain amino acid transport system ATP-binding protein